jgi:aldose sugar dehydrogenase
MVRGADYARLTKQRKPHATTVGLGAELAPATCTTHASVSYTCALFNCIRGPTMALTSPPAGITRPTRLGLAALAFAAASSSTAQPGGDAVESFEVVTVVDGLVNPWSMAFLPNGDMLVTERAGELRIVRNGRLLPNDVPGVPAVRAIGQGGLQDVVLHPDFATNQTLYLSYSKGNADNSLGTTALSRARFVNDRLADVEEIFEAKAWNERPGHFGARIAFDRDGYLFMSVGDRMAGLGPNGMDPDLFGHPAQDLSNHQGTIVRLNDDGSVPDDNPFVGRPGALPEIWSYGHRNPQGLAVHPETNALWETEHGPQGGDELNLIVAGRNYGWPVIGYGANYTLGTTFHVSRMRPDMEQPAMFWVPSIATSGLAIYTGDAFPNWKGNAFVGGMSAQYRQLVRVTLEGDIASDRQALLLGEYRIRDVRQGPDGFVYIATDNVFGNPSPILRLEPSDD